MWKFINKLNKNQPKDHKIHKNKSKICLNKSKIQKKQMKNLKKKEINYKNLKNLIFYNKKRKVFLIINFLLYILNIYKICKKYKIILEEFIETME